MSSAALGQVPSGPGAPPPGVESGERGFGIVELVLALAGPVVLVLLWRMNVIRPGSFEGARGIGRRNVYAWPWWFYLLCAGTVFFAQSAGAGIGAALARATGARGVPGGGDRSLAEQAGIALGAGVAGAVAGLALLWLLSQRTPGGPSTHGLWVRPTRRAVLTGLVGIVVTLPILYGVGLLSQLVFVLLTGQPTHALNHETLRTLDDHRGSPAAWALAASAVVTAPIVEELLFRVFLQSAVLRLVRRTWPAILITALLFTAVHLGGGVTRRDAYVLPTLFVLGVAMGVAYERTRNVWASIVMHVVFNAFNVALVMLMVEPG